MKVLLFGTLCWSRICTTADADDMLFGPNVCEPPSTPSGIFGLSHAELIESEWLVDDALTVKVKIELRPQIEYLDQESIDDVVVLPSTIGDKMLHLLDTGSASDVAFMVQQEEIRAHSQILSACSEVLERQLACGMKETALKQVVIEDCDLTIFRAFLRYVYSDSFAPLEGLVACP